MVNRSGAHGKVQEARFILSEERTFLRGVPETLGRRSG
jgi:hypothetical protein